MIQFPKYTGLRCLMMPYIQGDPASVPKQYHSYADILRNTWLRQGDVGYLTIDESVVDKGQPHRGTRAKHGRALHTEAGRLGCAFGWGLGWGSSHHVTLDHDVEILIASNVENSCAVWNVIHENTSIDGDIGYCADQYPYSAAKFLKAGEVCRIGILTPHESLPVRQTTQRQFLRIVSSGVHGRELYFTENPLIAALATLAA